MNPTLRPAALAALVAAGAFAGCRTSVNTVDPANPTGAPSPEAMSHMVTDSSLADAVVPVFYNKGKTESDFTIVQLQVQNRSRSVARVNYRVEWFDTNGIAITSPAPITKPLVIEAGATETIKAVALTPKAVDARIRFQESKNN